MTAVRPEGRQDMYPGYGTPGGPPNPGAFGAPVGYGGHEASEAYGPVGERTGAGSYRGAEPDAWSVYDAGEQPYRSDYPWLADQTLQLRAIPGGPAAHAPGADGAERRRADQGRVSLRSGSGRRRATGPRAPVPRRKESRGVIAARLVGEVCITFGLVMLLFVSYQLWWTNVQADASAGDARSRLEQQWAVPSTPAPGQSAAPDPGVFAPGQGFAILYVPKLGLKYPIAEGTDTEKVLNKGLVGHYTGTAMPGATGNFAVAAHRTTHGQPFRKIGQLVPGDKIVVETATAYYTYEVQGGIPETPPTNVTVLQPVPKGSPFSQAGQYMTMTTCTPEFSARGRLVVFSKMVDQRPRSQGQPPALTAP